MSQIGKTSFITQVISSLSAEEISALSALVDSISTYESVSIVGNKYQLAPYSAETGSVIKAVVAQLTASEFVRGILIHNATHCVILAFSDNSCEKINAIRINSTLNGYERLSGETISAETFRIMVNGAGGGSTGGVVIQVDEDITLESPNPSWLVPKLTAAQVTQAYNALAAGKHCTITNADGNVHYTAMLSDTIQEEPNVVISHYWLGLIDYQVASNNTVTITAHEAGGGGSSSAGHTLTIKCNSNTNLMFEYVDSSGASHSESISTAGTYVYENVVFIKSVASVVPPVPLAVEGLEIIISPQGAFTPTQVLTEKGILFSDFYFETM